MNIQNLTISYKQKVAIDNVSLEIASGKLTGIVGPNGAGKSTLLKGMMGLIPRENGQVTLDGKPLAFWRERIAYVPQRSEVDLTFPITVLDMVILGTFPALGLIKRPRKKEKQLALDALEQVEMTAFQKRQIGELSGGQLQRVFIARALAQHAEIFFLDEPFAGIDMTSEALIMQLLKKLRDNGKTIVVVHHDFHKVAAYFDDIILLNKKLIAHGPVELTFTEDKIKYAYGELTFAKGV
ncbi:metal ABC transporter ATP-binding protein [Listeria ivanovii]|uniref:Metal ABC transporter ATP-binding protein n=2 Tax=Listeria ivanovii TaxID=1638 RepID=A0ABS1G3X0_LISIV|nr:metal ABC transporter ATP-binding protein [Listeria ivanovii]AIS60255.1 manganese ABC transporter ATP-binding protein [Listeria ivanovii subsp. londoniensis]AIS63080.1 manganese ABC transporter ATP-binding protein [Listeria ivanovii subsp. londoniensis]MBC2255239.1 metal ABC transporter ATP-binding protein [Listeria ivanovii]MBK1961346.1 metal ABC transporter ATP-binding protein [Listeria ivanovii subsp. londoniensis]MBK1966651.1 metal ABC transporter ATP-binding protein [Listeria ivanovii 